MEMVDTRQPGSTNKTLVLGLSIFALLCIAELFLNLPNPSKRLKLPTFSIIKWGQLQTSTPDGPAPLTEQTQCGLLVSGINPSMGLGNMMFVTASLIGVARTNRKKPILIVPKEFPLDLVYRLKIPRAKQTPPGLSVLGEQSCCRFNQQAKDLSCKQSYIMSGYFQSFKYFESSRAEILRQFQFRQTVLNRCVVAIEKARTNRNCTLVGAHMRRGDFTLAHKMQFGHWPAQPDYLLKAIAYFRDKLRGNSSCLRFVVLGNDFQWNKKNSPNHSDVDVLKMGSPGEDMCILSRCDHSIISSGSFGWWAAYIAGGLTTYQKTFARPGSALFNEFLLEDYVKADWVPL